MNENEIKVEIVEKKGFGTKVKDWWQHPKTGFGKFVRKAAPVAGGIAIGALVAGAAAKTKAGPDVLVDVTYDVPELTDDLDLGGMIGSEIE